MIAPTPSEALNLRDRLSRALLWVTDPAETARLCRLASALVEYAETAPEGDAAAIVTPLPIRPTTYACSWCDRLLDAERRPCGEPRPELRRDLDLNVSHVLCADCYPAVAADFGVPA